MCSARGDLRHTNSALSFHQHKGKDKRRERKCRKHFDGGWKVAVRKSELVKVGKEEKKQKGKEKCLNAIAAVLGD